MAADSDVDANELNEIIGDFLVESHENLDRLDRELVELEVDPTQVERLASIFRTIHTIKGGCAFLGFTRLERVSHTGENLLSRLRDRTLELTSDITTGLLALIDAIRRILAHIEQDRTEGEEDFSALIAMLVRLQEGKPESAREERGAVVEEEPARLAPLGELLIDAGKVSSEDVARAAQRQAAGDPRRMGELLVDQGVLHPNELADALKRQVETQLASATVDTIRVDVTILDRLMNLVGELVLVRNQILQVAGAKQIPEIAANAQRLNLITTELQENVMKTRMQPIGSIAGRFPRLVRDLAKTCGKQVRLDLEGSGTELDRTLIEAIKDPLTHLVRNSVDHGIETPDQRIAAGKSPEGRLLIRAYHEGGQVNIEISDDGGGIDPERIREKAVAKGLLAPDTAARMSDHELVQLIFVPGFSTAQKVTNISGRGVGMDVVRTNIEAIGGRIEVDSAVGRGTTVKVRIPLTLAILPGVIVTSQGSRFALPQINLVELVRLDGDPARRGIERIMGAPVLRLRGNLLPLVSLAEVLSGGGPMRVMPDDQPANIAVLRTDDGQFGLIIDEVQDILEIVVKPLNSIFKGIGIYAGGTILGDGEIVLIIDVAGLAKRVGIAGQRRDQRQPDEASKELEAGAMHTLLTFDAGAQGRMAVPLASLARLEELPTSAIEWVGGVEMVTYRGGVLPLIRLETALLERRSQPRPSEESAEEAERAASAATCQVMVVSGPGRSVGILVKRVLDVVEDRLDTQRAATRPGILGSVVLQGKVVQLLDLEYVVRSIDPGFFEQAA